MKPKDLSGQRFGRLLVTSEFKSVKRGSNGRMTRSWRCLCDCGDEKWVAVDGLTCGRTNSCGCLRIETTAKRSITHGKAVGRKSTKELKSWGKAKSRCYCKTDHKYRIYGERGITMSEEWRNSSTRFLEDMGPCPEGYTLDRIDVNGPYSKENCRWSTRKQQGRNTRYNVVTELGVLSEVAE